MTATTKHPVTKLLTLYLIGLGALILLAGNCSCVSQKKFNRTGLKHQDWLAELSQRVFPIDTTSVQLFSDTTKADNKDYTRLIDSLEEAAYIASKSVKIDTVYSEKDCNELVQKMHIANRTLSDALRVFKREYEKCKPTYITKTKTVTVRDTRELYMKDQEIKKLKEEKKKIDGDLARKEAWNKWLLGACLIAVAFIFILRR